MSIHGIIFTGMMEELNLTRPAGAYRLRTWLAQYNYNIEVIDYFKEWKWQELELLCKKYITEETLFVGISTTFFQDASKINLLFKLVKEKYPHVKTIIGGPEVGGFINLDNSKVDRYIWGYCEQTLLHYLDFLSNKRMDDLNWFPYNNSLAYNAEEQFKNDITDLSIEWKKEDLLECNYIPIEISRGCIFKCSFCQFPLLGKKKSDYIRYENNLSNEFRYNYEHFGITNYSFQDDTFNDNILKLEIVGNAIAKSNVKITYSSYLRADLLSAFPDMINILDETGLIAANFGIESLNPKSRSTIGKGGNLEQHLEAIKTLKSKRPIFSWTGMIVGLPYESIDSIYNSHKWFIEQDKTYFNRWHFFPLGLRLNPRTRVSEFEKNYDKYGYSIDPNEGKSKAGNYNVYWKNEHMDFNIASQLCKELNEEIRQIRVQKNSIDQYFNLAIAAGFGASSLVGAGLNIADIIDDTYDLNHFKQSLNRVNEGIKNYKRLKLTSK